MKSITKQTKILADKWTKEMQADLEYHCEHLKMNPKPLSKYANMQLCYKIYLQPKFQSI